MKLKINKNIFTKFLIILISTYLMNMFYFKAISHYQKILTWFVVLFYLFINIKVINTYIKKINKKITGVLCLGFLWLVIILLTPIIHNTNDFSYLSTLINLLGFFINQIAIIVLLTRHPVFGNIRESYMKVIVYSSVFYVLSTISCLIFPSIREVIIKLIDISEENLFLLRIEKYSTRIGFAGFSGYSASLKCAIANSFVIIFIMEKLLKKEKIGLKLISLYLFTALGCFFYSRTSIIAILIFLVVTILYSCFKAGNLKLFFSMSIAILLVTILFPYLFSIADKYDSLRWIFEPILNYNENENFSSTSSDHLIKDMLFSIDEDTFLLGDGKYTGPSGYYMKTDIGFMRLILYFGIFGVILTYYIDLLVVNKIKKCFDKSINQILSMLLLITLIIFECKGESIILVFPIYFCLLCCCLLSMEE